MSISMWPYGLQPARLFCPQDSPGWDTGVGCPALLQVIFLTQGLNSSFLHHLHCRQFFATSTTWLIYLFLFLFLLFEEVSHRESCCNICQRALCLFSSKSFTVSDLKPILSYFCVWCYNWLYSWHTTLLVSGVIHSELTFAYIMKWPRFSSITICPQNYGNIIDHIPYAVYYIPVAYLFYNWMFVSLNPHHLFCSIITFPSVKHPFVVCIYESAFFFFSLLICFVVCFFFFK